MVWYSHLFQNLPQFIVIHTVKGFGIVNKAEIDVFLELSCFLDDPADVGNLVSGSSAFSKTKANGGDGTPVELFQILEVDAVKCCTQYASKFGKLKGQFSFQSQRMLKLLHNCTHLTC